MTSIDRSEGSEQPALINSESLDATGLSGLRWDNRFVEALPVDPDTEVRPRQVNRAMSSLVTPVVASAPALVAWSDEVAAKLGLSATAWTDHPSVMAQVLSGSHIVDGMKPHAAAYGGHQFGNWAGQLGDGRAIALGEVIDVDGGRQTLQLKGAGPTPYSRGADGFAVMRSSIREFLCSEAMHHLGVATTRALSLVATGDKVVRDMFYDGNPRPEPGAVVCRVAPSFIRFGNFQLFAARQQLDELRALVDFTISNHFAHLLDDQEPGSDAVHVAMFDEVCRTTCAMVVDWMRVGFVHGVMNTDNMSIHGATIDYGPYGWLEGFDPGWTPNTTDAAHRRYRYGQQPQVAQWNLIQLANAMVQLSGEVEPYEQALHAYVETHDRDSAAMWRAKLGLDDVGADAEVDDLVTGLFELLVATETDMTIFFRALAAIDLHGSVIDEVPAALQDAYYEPAGAVAHTRATLEWLGRYRELAARHDNQDRRRAAMNDVNPKFVLRNYLAQQAIDQAEQDNFEPVMDLLDVMRNPYDDQPGRDAYAAKRPEWARQRPGCSQLSCSS